MWTIGICDDNPHFALMLSQKIHDLCAFHLSERIDCKVLPLFNSAVTVKEYLKTRTINVLFLDIDMPDVNGFQLAEYIREEHPDTVIVFVSAYEDFVYSSFDYSPFRFLRKSHLIVELPETFDKIVQRCLLDKEALVFDTTEGEVLLRIKDIILFEGQKNYYEIKMTSGKFYKCRGTLNSVEEIVSKYDFFRVHSSYIINFEHIKKLDNDHIFMHSDENINISRRKYGEFKTSYMEFIRRRMTR